MHSSNLDAEQLRAEVKRVFAELGVLASCDPKAQVTTQAAEAQKPEPEPPPSPEVIAAFDAANALIDQALARKTWTEDDRQKLRERAQ